MGRIDKRSMVSAVSKLLTYRVGNIKVVHVGERGEQVTQSIINVREYEELRNITGPACPNI